MANKIKIAMAAALTVGFIVFAIHNGSTGFLNLLNFLGSVFHGNEFANYIGLSFRQFGKDVATFTGPASPIEIASLLLGIGTFAITAATVFLILTRKRNALAQAHG